MLKVKVKVKVKGHVIRALSWILGMSYSVIDGLVIISYHLYSIVKLRSVNFIKRILDWIGLVSSGLRMQVTNLSPTVVFIFGGPGTQKGKYIECLTDMYGFHCITICKVLEEELGESRVYEMKSADMANVTIVNVLQWFSDRMARKKAAAGFIIDIVPNIKVGLTIISLQS